MLGTSNLGFWNGHWIIDYCYGGEIPCRHRKIPMTKIPVILAAIDDLGKDWTPSQLAQALEAMSHLRSLGWKTTSHWNAVRTYGGHINPI